MNIFFDVDDTLISWDVHLRPGVHEVMGKLRADGHRIYIWSGRGVRWEVVHRFNLRHFIENCYWKPLFDHEKRLSELGVPVVPDYTVDDHKEIIDVFGGTVVVPPERDMTHDREMWRTYDEFTEFVRVHGDRPSRPVPPRTQTGTITGIDFR
jgi:FMN phosphatase YigB (HAD superfamily)